MILLLMQAVPAYAQWAGAINTLDYNNTPITAGCDPLLARLTENVTYNGNPITFKDTALGAPYNSHTWILGFSVPIVTHQQSPNFIFTPAGTYTIKLVITPDGVNYDTLQQTVTVYPKPVVNFGIASALATRQGCSPYAITLCDSTPGAVSWIWGDNAGNGGSTKCWNDTVRYDPVSGLNCYTITLIVTNQFGCLNSLTKNNYVCVAKPPIAALSVNNPVICDSPWVVQFHDSSRSVNPLVYNWNFYDLSSGANNFSNLKNPSHKYGQPGNYKVTLQVTDTTCNLTGTKTIDTIKLRTGFVNYANSKDTICLGEPIYFSGYTSNYINKIRWVFGPPGAVDSVNNFNYTYTTPGTWLLHFIGIDTTTGCSYTDTLNKKILVNPVPIISFTQNDSVSCRAPFTVNFTPNISGTVSNVLWQFKDTSTNTLNTSSQLSPTYTYDSSGTYNVKLSVTNLFGCSSSVVKPNLIKIAPTVINFKTDSSQGCGPVTVHFTNLTTSIDPVVSYKWIFGDTLAANDSSLSLNAVHTYDSVGVYNACLIVQTQTGCIGQKCIKISVGKKPHAGFSISTDTVCVHDTIGFVNNSSINCNTFLWDFGDGKNSAAKNPPPHSYTSSGNFTIKLTASFNGCKDDTSINVRVNNPTALFSTFFNCNTHGSVNFINQSTAANRWHWDFGDTSVHNGSDTSNLKDATYVYPTTGQYTIKLTAYNDTTHCFDTISKTIIVSLLNVSWTASQWNGCVGQPITFNSVASGFGVKYLWDFGDPLSNANTSVKANDTHIYADTGRYSVSLTVKDSNGCTANLVRIDTIDISKIIVDFSYTNTVGCMPASNQFPVTFTDNSVAYGRVPYATINSWKWDFGDGFSATTPTAFHAYTAPGQFTVTHTLTNNAGCIYQKIDTNLVYINKPVAKFTTSFNLFCASEPVQFINTSLANGPIYHWDFGDQSVTNGSDTSNITNPAYTYTNLGYYTVCLKVTDNLGCKDSICRVDSIHIANPNLSFTANSTYRFCPPHRVDFTNLANFDTVNVASLEWYFGDGGSSNIKNPTHIYNTAGSFDVKLVVKFNNGCADSITYPGFIKIGGAVGNITAVGDTGCNPLKTCYNAHTIGGTVAYIWYFGDNSPAYSGSDTACHLYTTPGIYHPAVLLVDTQHPTCQYILPYNDSILVDTVITNFYLAKDTFCQALGVTFTDSSYSIAKLPIVKWHWDFGDGTTDSIKNPMHAFNVFGDLTVTLTAYDSEGCFSTNTKKIHIHKKPTALFDISDTIGCGKLLATFRDSSIAGDATINFWHFDFGDGHAIPLGSDTANVRFPLPYMYQNTGLYQTLLAIKDTNGCVDTAHQIIIIYPNPNGIVGPKVLSICWGDTIQLQGSPTYTSYNWTPGKWLSDSTIAQPLAYPKDTTVYTLLTTDKHGCFTLDTLTINVKPLPTLVAMPKDTFACLGTSVQLTAIGSGPTFAWLPNYELSNAYIANPIATPKHTVTYIVKNMSLDGCYSLDSVHIMVNVFMNEFVASRVCVGDSTHFIELCSTSDLPISGYHWLFGDPLGNQSVALNPAFEYADSGSYKVSLILTDPHNCLDTTTKLVRVDHHSQAKAMGDTLICKGAAVQLHASGGDTIVWNPNYNIDNRYSFNPTVSPEYTTTYVASITYGVCPFDTAHVTVRVDDTPLLETLPDVTILKGSAIELRTTINFGDSITWSPTDSLSCTNCASPIAKPDVTTTYTAIVIDKYGCTNTKSLTVSVDTKCSPDQIFVGNGFTPNNDGINDVAYARLYGLKDLHYYRVFDRWGELIFESKDRNLGWDGKNSKGEQLNSGVYVYDIEAECFNGNIVHKTGNVTLIK